MGIGRAVLELLTRFHVECWLQEIVHKIWTIPWCPARKIFYNNKVFLKFKLRIHNVQHWWRTYISAWYPQRHCVTCLVSPKHQVRSSSPSKLWQLASQRPWNGMERGDQNAELFSPIFLAWRDSLNLSPDFLRCLWFLVVCGGKLKWSEREEKGLLPWDTSLTIPNMTFNFWFTANRRIALCWPAHLSLSLYSTYVASAD